MANFRRIKIQATVETAAMLLAEDKIDGAVDELCDKHVAVTQVAQGLNELPDGPSGTIEALNDHDLQLSLRRVRHEPTKVDAVFLRPRGNVGIGGHYVSPPT